MLTEETLEQDIDQFTTELKNLLKEQKRYYSDPVELYCRDEVEWLYIARIYNVLFGLGMSDVTFAVGAG